MLDSIFQDTMVNMKWTDIEDYVNKNALVVLPLGVIEEHGPHLCLGTDILTAHIYCLSIKEKLEEEGHTVVIAPPFYWGICQSTGGFLGSFRIRKETAKALLYDILASLTCSIRSQSIVISNVEFPDIHAGDIETAIIHKFYPHLVDVEKAKSLAPVALENDKTEQWLFGGHIKALSSEGYLGIPADYENVEVESYIDDYTERISDAILGHIVYVS